MDDDLYDMSSLETNHTFRQEMTTIEITEWIAKKLEERKWNHADFSRELQLPLSSVLALMNGSGNISVSLLTRVGLVFQCRVVVNFVHLGTDVTKPVPDTGGKNAV